MYYIGLDVHKRKISYCVKDSGDKAFAEGSLPATRLDLDLWMKTLPQPHGQNLVQRLVLPALTADINFPLGSDSFEGPFYALGLKSAPGSPHTAAVSTGIFNGSPSSTGITIFDDTTPRATRAPGWNTSDKAYGDIEWGSDPSTMYAPAEFIATDLYVLSVDGNGIQISKDFTGALIFPSADFDVHFDTGTGLLYTDGGQVVRPSDATVVGTLGATGMVAPDSSLNRIFVLGQTMIQAGNSNFTIESFDQTSFAAIGSMTISNVVGTPTRSTFTPLAIRFKSPLTTWRHTMGTPAKNYILETIGSAVA
jgi:hypothetical protein